MLTSRFRLWAFALFAFATLCTARTVITSSGCTTHYCDHPTAKVYYTTKTISKNTPYTVTRWKTATKPKYTVPATGTKTITSRPIVTILTVTSLHTKWIGTTTYTRRVTITTPAATETVPYTTTKTVTPPGKTVSAPAGFVGINDDPENKNAGVATNLPPWNPKRREASPKPAPEPVPAAKQYISAVTCTKTIITKTGTSDLWKTTTKTVGTTTKIVAYVTLTDTLPVSTVTAKNAKTINTTTSLYKVAFASVTSTRTVTSGTAIAYLGTVTTVLPTPTNYLACGDRNQSPTFAQRQNFAVAITLPKAPGDPSFQKTIIGKGGAADCCALCHAYPGPELCIGSIFYYTGLWGDPGPGCDWENEDTPECNPPEPEFDMDCRLILVANKPGTCPRTGFTFEFDSAVNPVVISNGPHCPYWKFHKNPN
ncbi:hypothetical protein TWF694_005980 [Orbilia ellipsospora]|uniref:Uncharacterized protein n=1 Tax=Orbilia ellipsospora TaxID=2528407 RepID=A0AAV9WRY4_9PEZI